MEGLTKVGQTNWDIGEKERQLEDKRDLVKQQGLTAASALENAATYNKQGAANTILGAIGSTAASLGAQSINNPNTTKTVTPNALPPVGSLGINGNTDSPDNTAFNSPTDNSTVALPQANISGLAPDQAAQITTQMNALLSKGNLTAEEQAQLKQYRDLLKGYSTQ